MEGNRGSLYEYISSAVVDGQLPRDFSLPQEAEDNRIRWTDGALDGVSIFHMGVRSMKEQETGLMEEAVAAASQGDMEEAERLFVSLGQKVRAIHAIDALQSYILENKDTLSAANLYRYGISAAAESSDRECVKFGLSILELFNTDDDDVRAVIKTLGLSDEFSIFAVFIMRDWKDGNDQIYDLARKIHGWGRIHAIEHLEPETEEIRQWLLREGVHNAVLPAYSALECWTKGRGAEALEGDLSREDFSGIRDIIAGLLDEAPCPGISRIENGYGQIAAFLHRAKDMELNLEDYEAVRSVKISCEDKNPDIARQCESLLNSEKCKNFVRQAVKRGEGVELARDLNVDYKDDILKVMRAEFDRNYGLCGYLMDDPALRTEVLDIFREHVPLDEMKAQPTDSLGMGEEFKKHIPLELILQGLRDCPLEGAEFVETALQCSPVRIRNYGLGVLENWVAVRELPLEQLLPSAFRLLGRLRETEVNRTTAERMGKLLEWETVFDQTRPGAVSG